jgi:hypothetical protein
LALSGRYCCVQIDEAPADYPIATLLVGLNGNRDAYEGAYDPHDIDGQIDPVMLPNFSRLFGLHYFLPPLGSCPSTR